MEQKTVSDILKMESITLTMLSAKVGVCISLLSKIDKDNVSVTRRTQEKFQAIYPNFELVNGKPKWKTKYEEMKERYDLLANDYANLTMENEELRKRINVASEYLKTGDISRISYNTREKY